MSRRKQEINIFKIAEEAGVSISTVSRVMNHRSGVSEKNRVHINSILRHYNFKPDYPAAHPPKIGIITPWDDLISYVRQALKGVFRYARANAIEVSLLTRSSNRSMTLLKQVRDQQCSGVIVLMTEQFEGEHLELGTSELPILFLDAPANLENTGFVDNDSYSGSCAATRHLLELGHRKIGFIHYGELALNHIQRLSGYQNVLKENKIVPNPKWIATPPPQYHIHNSSVAGVITMRRLMKQAPEITAVMAIDDEMALGAMSAIQQSGRKIPEDISVVGFDNYPESEAYYPPLTTVDHPIEEAGYLAAEAIGSAVKSHGKWSPLRKILPTRLVIRESTGRNRERK